MAWTRHSESCSQIPRYLRACDGSQKRRPTARFTDLDARHNRYDRRLGFGLPSLRGCTERVIANSLTDNRVRATWPKSRLSGKVTPAQQDDRRGSGRRAGQDAENFRPDEALGPTRGDCGCRPLALQRRGQLCHRPVDLGRWRLCDALGVAHLRTSEMLADADRREFMKAGTVVKDVLEKRKLQSGEAMKELAAG